MSHEPLTSEELAHINVHYAVARFDVKAANITDALEEERYMFYSSVKREWPRIVETIATLTAERDKLQMWNMVQGADIQCLTDGPSADEWWRMLRETQAERDALRTALETIANKSGYVTQKWGMDRGLYHSPEAAMRKIAREALGGKS